MLQNLIKILEGNKPQDICSVVGCNGVESCKACPLNNKDNMSIAIKELKQAQEKQGV